MTYNVPKLTFAIVSDSLHAGHFVPCLRCGESFRLGAATWAMCCGRERIGYVCEDCLTPDARQRLDEAARQVAG